MRQFNRRNHFHFTSFIILIVLISLIAVSACSETPAKPAQTTQPTAKPAANQPISGGTLRVGLNADSKNLGYPQGVQGPTELMPSRASLEALGWYDENDNLIPWLAESWTADAQSKTVTLKLRKGVTFHDGTVFDATACKWNLDQYLLKKKAELATIASVDIVDDYTVRCNLKQWDNTVISNLGMFAIMISPTAFKTNGEEWCMTHPIGTGPFILESWTRDVKQAYKKNPNYWQKGKPYLDRLEYIPIKEAMTKLAAFKVGDVDVLAAIDAQDVKDFEASPDKYRVNKVSSGQFCFMGDSVHADSPFSNVYVRRAITYAIDYSAIIKGILYGLGETTNQWGPKSNWGYNTNIQGYPYSPDKAKEMLAKAGNPSFANSKLYFENYPNYITLNTAVQEYLKKAGMDIKLEPTDPGKFYDYVTLGWTNGILYTPIRSNPDLSLVMPRMLRQSAAIYSKGLMHPKDLEDAFVQVTLAPDQESKKKIIWEMQRLVFDEYCIMTPSNIGQQSNVEYKKVHDSGYPGKYSQWNPFGVWMEK